MINQFSHRRPVALGPEYFMPKAEGSRDLSIAELRSNFQCAVVVGPGPIYCGLPQRPDGRWRCCEFHYWRMVR